MKNIPTIWNLLFLLNHSLGEDCTFLLFLLYQYKPPQTKLAINKTVTVVMLAMRTLLFLLSLCAGSDVASETWLVFSDVEVILLVCVSV